ncbi:unnamed protein product [Closterium sp. NIES-53]
MVCVVEPTVSLAPEGVEDFKAVAAAVQANLTVVLLDSGCSHHLMGTKEAFVEMKPEGHVEHVRSFNGDLQPVKGRGTFSLRSPHPPTCSTSWACMTTSPCSTKPSLKSTEVVALHTIASVKKSTPDKRHARLAHVGVDTIKSSAKHDVATSLGIKPSIGADLPCVSCVGGKLARHTFPDKGSDAKDALTVVHIDLCGPFRVAAKDGSLYFLLLKDRKTRYERVKPVAKKSDVLWVFEKWLLVVERQMKKTVPMLRSDHGGEFLRKEFTDFVDGKGIVHNLICPYTPQQNGMAELEMHTVVEAMLTMLLHMGVQHHWWHLTLQQAVWVRNCLERSMLPSGTTPYQLLIRKRPNLRLARVWGCMVQFMVPEQQHGGKLAPKACWGIHLGMSLKSKGWEVLDLTENKIDTMVEAIFYETLSLEVWKVTYGPASGRTQANPPIETSTTTFPLLAKVGEPADEAVDGVLPPPPPLVPNAPPTVVDLLVPTPPLATGDEGSLEASPVAPASGVCGGQCDAKLVDKGEQQTGKSTKEVSTKEKSASGPTRGGELVERLKLVKQRVDYEAVDNEGDLSAGEESIDSDVVEVPVEKPDLRRSGQTRRPPERLSFHACLLPGAFPSLLYRAEADVDLPELHPDMHADPEHRWDIATMTVKEGLASWKGKAVKAAKDDEIRSLMAMGTWELVERPRGVNVMKNRWVLMTKYHIDDTVAREKAHLVVKGFTQVYGADYDEAYAPVGSYVTLRIFLRIVVMLDLHLMQLDMKNAFLQSKLDNVLYMYQPVYYDDGTGRVYKLLKSVRVEVDAAAVVLGNRRGADQRQLEEKATTGIYMTRLVNHCHD